MRKKSCLAYILVVLWGEYVCIVRVTSSTPACAANC